MGTHPIFESDFDCLTEMIAGVVKCVRLLSKYQLPLTPVRRSTTLAKYGPAPSVNSIAKNTAICVVLCGGGDVLAQVFLHGGNLEKLKTGYDTRRTFHYAISGAFMGPWFAWWFPFLARHYASVWTRLGLELLTTPFLHAGFVLCYSQLRHGKWPTWDVFIDKIIQLLQVDLLIYSPIALFNFAFIPAGIYQTIFVNAAYVLLVEPIGSLIINNGVRLVDVLRLVKRQIIRDEVNPEEIPEKKEDSICARQIATE